MADRKKSLQLALPDKTLHKVAEIDEYKMKKFKETTKNKKIKAFYQVAELEVPAEKFNTACKVTREKFWHVDKDHQPRLCTSIEASAKMISLAKKNLQMRGVECVQQMEAFLAVVGDEYEEKKRGVETSYAELQKMKATEKVSEAEDAKIAHKTAVEKLEKVIAKYEEMKADVLSDIENVMKELMASLLFFIRKGPETQNMQSISFQTYHQTMDQYCSAISRMDLPKETTTVARVSTTMSKLRKTKQQTLGKKLRSLSLRKKRGK
ncbi:hypothetical protein WR25_10510 [Diploscapter pachys]|uniref:BAR domain-containing protein n=1 Tax=Diploscapter pachys TaxID=2018661 RepID=A0A2A2JYD5_9BILA|nr:hypothetical protein WR25_10510 [Diploscapter pachys]